MTPVEIIVVLSDFKKNPTTNQTTTTKKSFCSWQPCKTNSSTGASQLLKNTAADKSKCGVYRITSNRVWVRTNLTQNQI